MRILREISDKDSKGSATKDTSHAGNGCRALGLSLREAEFLLMEEKERKISYLGNRGLKRVNIL